MKGWRTVSSRVLVYRVFLHRRPPPSKEKRGIVSERRRQYPLIKEDILTNSPLNEQRWSKKKERFLSTGL